MVEERQEKRSLGGFLDTTTHAGTIRAVPGGTLDLEQVFFQQCQSRNMGKAWLVLKKGRGITEANRSTKAVSVLSTSYPITAAMSKRWFASCFLLMGLALGAQTIISGEPGGNKGFECGFLRFSVLEVRGGPNTKLDGPVISAFNLIPTCDRTLSNGPFPAGETEFTFAIPCDNVTSTNYRGFRFETARFGSPDLDPYRFSLEQSHDGTDWALLAASGTHVSRLRGTVLEDGPFHGRVPTQRGAQVDVSFNPGQRYQQTRFFSRLTFPVGFILLYAAYWVGRVEYGKPVLVLTCIANMVLRGTACVLWHVEKVHDAWNFDWISVVLLGFVAYIIAFQERRFTEVVSFAGFVTILISLLRDIAEEGQPLGVFRKPSAIGWGMAIFGFSLWVMRRRLETSALKKIEPDKQRYDKVWESLLADETSKAAMERIAHTLSKRGRAKLQNLRPRQMHCAEKRGIQSLSSISPSYDISVHTLRGSVQQNSKVRSSSTTVFSSLPWGGGSGHEDVRASRQKGREESPLSSRGRAVGSGDYRQQIAGHLSPPSLRGRGVGSGDYRQQIADHLSPIRRSLQTQIRPSAGTEASESKLGKSSSLGTNQKQQLGWDNRLQKRQTVPPAGTPTGTPAGFPWRKLALGAASPFTFSAKFKEPRRGPAPRVLTTSLDLLYTQAAVALPILNFKVCEWASDFRGRFPMSASLPAYPVSRAVSLDDTDETASRLSRERSCGELCYPLWTDIEGDEDQENRVRWPGLKRPERAVEKMMRSYGGHAWMILDIARHAMVFERASELDSCLEAILNDSDVEVCGVKNRLRTDYNSKASAGYRDVLVNLNMVTREARDLGVDGFVCELQLQLQAFASLKNDGGHKRYVEFRNERAQ